MLNNIGSVIRGQAELKGGLIWSFADGHCEVTKAWRNGIIVTTTSLILIVLVEFRTVRGLEHGSYRDILLTICPSQDDLLLSRIVR